MEKQKDLFLLGAGFSHSMYPHMPLMSELTDKLSKAKVVQQWSAFGNIEDLLTYLSQALPWETDSRLYRKRADFFEITKLLSDDLSERQEKIPERDIEDHRMGPLIRRWHEDRSAIVTLNYDSLVEEALETLCDANSSEYFPVMLAHPETRDGVGMFAHVLKPSAKIFKLHGSLTWYYSGNESFFGETIYHGPRKLPLDESDPVYRGLYDKVPLVVPPTFEKSSFFKNETIRAVWRLAGKAIQAANRIFVIGYSLPESDSMMKYFLKANLSSEIKKRVVVVDPSAEVSRKFRAHFGEVADVEEFQSSSLDPSREFADIYGNRKEIPTRS